MVLNSPPGSFSFPFFRRILGAPGPVGAVSNRSGMEKEPLTPKKSAKFLKLNSPNSPPRLFSLYIEFVFVNMFGTF